MPALAGHRISPIRSAPAIPEQRNSRGGSPTSARPVMASVPVSRDVEGKSLPRAYVAHRRSSPRGIQVLTLPTEEHAVVQREVRNEPAPRPSVTVVSEPAVAAAPAAVPVPPTAGFSTRQMFYAAIAIVLVSVAVSTVVVLAVQRLLP
jgi:hypothetical protein